MKVLPVSTTLARGLDVPRREGWRLRRIGDLVQLHYGKALKEQDRIEGEIPVFGTNGRCGWHNAALAPGPGVILGRKGQGPLGVEWCHSDYWVIDTAYYAEVDRSELDLRFFYDITSYVGLNHLKDGTSNPGLSRDRFYAQAFPLPPLPAQRRIASILSAYDDLIENNTKRIAILEEMARSLYREWFVHFRFPGHEKVKLVDSELGKIPEGWRVTTLGDVATITMGNSPKGDTYNDTGEGVPLLNGPVEFGERFAQAVKWTTAPSRICRTGDLIVCVRGSTTGKNVKSDREYCLGRGVCALSGKYQAFIDNLFRQEMPSLLGQTSGSTFPSWSGPVLTGYPVRNPPNSLKEKFEAVCGPMNAQIQCLDTKNGILCQTRDLLLPKLISGAIDVDALDLPEAD